MKQSEFIIQTITQNYINIMLYHQISPSCIITFFILIINGGIVSSEYSSAKQSGLVASGYSAILTARNELLNHKPNIR